MPASEVEPELDSPPGRRRRLLDDVPAGRLDERVEPHRQRLRRGCPGRRGASPASWAALMSWSQVTGCVMSSPAASATDLRYQSSCVLAQNGTATSSSFQVGPRWRAGRRPRVTRCATSVGHRREEAGLRELGDVRRVEAHDVDRRVLGRQAADQLLALRRASRAAAATSRSCSAPSASSVQRAGDLGLAAGVGVDVPGEGRRAADRRRRRRPACRRRPASAAVPATPVGAAAAAGPATPAGPRPDRWMSASVFASVIASVGAPATGSTAVSESGAGHRGCQFEPCADREIGHRTDDRRAAAAAVSARGPGSRSPRAW